MKSVRASPYKLQIAYKKNQGENSADCGKSVGKMRPKRKYCQNYYQAIHKNFDTHNKYNPPSTTRQLGELLMSMALTSLQLQKPPKKGLRN